MTLLSMGGKRALVLVALGTGVLALVVGLLVTRGSGPTTAGAADHLDAPGLTPPGGDLRTDLTDVYAFRNGANTVLVMNVNGLTAAGKQGLFARSAPSVAKTKAVSYYFRVDNNGDAVADHNIRIQFGKPRGAGQVQRMRITLDGKPLVTGWSSPFGQVKAYRGARAKAYAGMRDDPFFFDLNGFINILAALDVLGLDSDPANNSTSLIGCTGQRPDAFAGSNVSAIVLELPSSLLTGADSKIGVWATTNKAGAQIDRLGRPAINTVFNPNSPLPPDRGVDGKASKKNSFNAAEPKDDQAGFRGEVEDTLGVLFSLNNAGGALGGTDDASDDAAQIKGLADVLLPDILTFDTASDDGFLNGRRLADDVIDAELGLVTEGLVKTDCVGSNDKAFLTAFPYLAAPHA